ncbi:FecCD family ABC transporter permease [Paenibacillus sp. URB8-2]|uniref:FecCD family ABC transporter permease n=1 Tax=Paenibacillus sp. URB8-2 TaxID=2741301 RepID=UPI0015BA454B|nr:iron ABC transporter permease [Paenibacillus sp. URB8-2]BCG59099.1 ferrichrome ABC transporter permease [Paenibacillus sp. URB8-2]
MRAESAHARVRWGKLLAVLVLLILSFSVSLVVGAKSTTLHEAWLALTSNVSGDDITLIREIRLPRIAAGILVGAALAVAGAIMQGLTRNPLADPGLLGITSGGNAALACALAFIPSLNYFGIMLACFAGAAAGALMVFGLGAASKSGLSSIQLVLAGAAISALLTAVAEGVALYFKLSKDVSMWTAAGLVGTSWVQVRSIAPFVIGGILISISLARPLTILSLNETAATGLGLKTGQIKAALYAMVIILAGSSVALVGNMVFLGLMVPHIVRTFAGTDYRSILPLSALGGAAFMLLADTMGRMVNAPFETPVAAIIAMLGFPFFLIIVRKGAKFLS